MARQHDIVLYGASGFTGELTARYLTQHMPAGGRWALGGRDRERLEAVRARLEALDPHAAALPIVIADADDEASLAALAGAASVVISTVGPYLLHGEPLVAACVAAGTDYLDLCAESEFVDRIYLRYHQAARESGARLVHACGFDALIADLGVLYTIGAIERASQRQLAVDAFVDASGRISGGTLRSAVHALSRLKESGRARRQRRSVERHADDGRLAGHRHVHGVSRRAHREPRAGGWVVPLPTIDRAHVLRSARLSESYGPDFSYSHNLVTRSLLKTARLLVLAGLVATLAQVRTTRRMLLVLRRAGAGPSEAARARSSFRVRFVAHVGEAPATVAVESGLGGVAAPTAVDTRPGSDPAYDLVTEVSGGDPGYGETAKMLAEAALCMAFDELPAAGGGQWTPAVALGQPLIDRLSASGISFRVIEGGRSESGACSGGE